MDARTWMNSLSTAGREESARPQPKSERGIGATTVTEYWDGAKWCERLQAWDGEKYIAISATFVYPPIPDRSMDWAVCLEGHEEGLTGRGETMPAAIVDLLEQIEEAK